MTKDTFSIASDLVDEQAAAIPELATYLGFAGSDHLLSDYSLEGNERVHALLRDHRDRIRLAEAGDDPWAGLAKAVIDRALSDEIDFFEHDDHRRELNSVASPIQDIRSIFDHMDTASDEGWENIAARLHAVPAALDQYRTRLESGRLDGLAVAHRQVVEAARQSRNYAASDGFFTAFVDRYEGDEALTTRLRDGADAARAGYTAIADYLESTYLPSAPSRDGVGPERYVRAAAKYLGTDLNPISTYEWGWSEVGRLLGRMQSVAEEISPGSSLADVLDLLSTDPARAAQSQEEFRDLMQERQSIALRELDGEHFDVPEPIKTVEVNMAPPGGSLGAYYVQPSEDYSRPGSIWWAQGDNQFIPLFDQVSTAYHEGFPGHHLQVGVQMAGADIISRYQKLLVWYPGTGEGWALYAEDIMEELGYLEKPDYVMGKLTSEMLRAARVVIDIGSHLDLVIPEGQPFHPGESWTFELGVEMLERYAAQAHDVAVSEMNRYLGWPGQAIAYKVGQQAIRDLRSAEQQRLGAAFDAKAFHASVLEIGSTGLDVLRRHVLG